MINASMLYWWENPNSAYKIYRNGRICNTTGGVIIGSKKRLMCRTILSMLVKGKFSVFINSTSYLHFLTLFLQLRRRLAPFFFIYTKLIYLWPFPVNITCFLNCVPFLRCMVSLEIIKQPCLLSPVSMDLYLV